VVVGRRHQQGEVRQLCDSPRRKGGGLRLAEVRREDGAAAEVAQDRG
jgi:hypothetical protein